MPIVARQRKRIRNVASQPSKSRDEVSSSKLSSSAHYQNLYLLGAADNPVSPTNINHDKQRHRNGWKQEVSDMLMKDNERARHAYRNKVGLQIQTHNAHHYLSNRVQLRKNANTKLSSTPTGMPLQLVNNADRIRNGQMPHKSKQNKQVSSTNMINPSYQ